MVTRRKVTVEELAYAAGVIDSDGYIGIGKLKGVTMPKYTVLLTVVNTSKDLMTWFQERFGGYVVNRKAISDNHKTTYYWRATNTLAVGVLEQIRPYMVIKTRQADIVTKFRQDWKGYRGWHGRDVPDDVLLSREETYRLMHEVNDDRRHLHRLSEMAPGNGEAIVRPASKDADVGGTETTNVSTAGMP